MKRNKSSKAWLHEHVTDPYVRRAKQEGYRSRAAYKLMEINQRDHLFKPGMIVVDLGSTPGGWSQVAADKIKPGGRVIAVDLLDMQAITGVTFVQGDFTEHSVVHRLEALLGIPGEKGGADLVISDMAPNISGVASTDQARSLDLAQKALDFTLTGLKAGGNFLIKVFQGEGVDEFKKRMSECFEQVFIRKPKASRDRSNEMYLLGLCRRVEPEKRIVAKS